MAYELAQCGNTQFAIDWSVVRRLVRSYYIAYHQLNYGREVTLSDSRWYNPMSWSLPDVSQIEVDWDAVRRAADADTDDDLRSMRAQAKTDPAGVAYRLESMIEAAARNKEAFVDWMGNIQTQNMHSIDEAVDAYESKIEIAKFVRDSSADGLMVGASVMSGGAALAVMGAGSMLKGEAKFQDTGSVGAGVMEGAGSFVFAYVKLGKAFSFKQDMVLALVQASYKTGTELVGGAAVGKATLSGALKLTGPAVDRLFKLGASKTMFDKVAVPLVITYDGQNVASKVLGKFAGTMVQKRGIEGAGKSALLGLGSSSGDNSSANDPPQRQGSVVAQATLTNKYLLYLAFVNMNNGIGRGW
jgi:hypothetical protein